MHFKSFLPAFSPTFVDLSAKSGLFKQWDLYSNDRVGYTITGANTSINRFLELFTKYLRIRKQIRFKETIIQRTNPTLIVKN